MVTKCPLEMQLRNTVGPECAQIWTGDENPAQEGNTVELNEIAAAIDAKQKEMT